LPASFVQHVCCAATLPCTRRAHHTLLPDAHTYRWFYILRSEHSYFHARVISFRTPLLLAFAFFSPHLHGLLVHVYVRLPLRSHSVIRLPPPRYAHLFRTTRCARLPGSRFVATVVAAPAFVSVYVWTASRVWDPLLVYHTLPFHSRFISSRLFGSSPYRASLPFAVLPPRHYAPFAAPLRFLPGHGFLPGLCHVTFGPGSHYARFTTTHHTFIVHTCVLHTGYSLHVTGSHVYAFWLDALDTTRTFLRFGPSDFTFAVHHFSHSLGLLHTVRYLAYGFGPRFVHYRHQRVLTHVRTRFLRFKFTHALFYYMLPHTPAQTFLHGYLAARGCHCIFSCRVPARALVCAACHSTFTGRTSHTDAVAFCRTPLRFTRTAPWLLHFAPRDTLTHFLTLRTLPFTVRTRTHTRTLPRSGSCTGSCSAPSRFHTWFTHLDCGTHVHLCLAIHIFYLITHVTLALRAHYTHQFSRTTTRVYIRFIPPFPVTPPRTLRFIHTVTRFLRTRWFTPFSVPVYAVLRSHHSFTRFLHVPSHFTVYSLLRFWVAFSYARTSFVPFPFLFFSLAVWSFTTDHTWFTPTFTDWTVYTLGFHLVFMDGWFTAVPTPGSTQHLWFHDTARFTVTPFRLPHDHHTVSRLRTTPPGLRYASTPHTRHFHLRSDVVAGLLHTPHGTYFAFSTLERHSSTPLGPHVFVCRSGCTHSHRCRSLYTVFTTLHTLPGYEHPVAFVHSLFVATPVCVPHARSFTFPV